MTKSTAAFWSSAANGYEQTASSELIEKTIKRIKEKHRFVLLTHKGYQSGNLIVVSVCRQYVTIDKPIDWPGLQKKIRVVFKDDANVWNYFTVSIIQDDKDTLKTEFPTELFRLQRRANFRVFVPTGTTASFVKNDKEYTEVCVGNLSAGGMMFCTSHGAWSADLIDQSIINTIIIRVPRKIGAVEKAKIKPGECYDYISVEKGIVVRSFPGEEDNSLCFGVQFRLKPKEEKTLSQYVRQSELDALRKGVSA